MNHHHHTLDDEVKHHSHPLALHNAHGQHDDHPDWSPAHIDHDHLHGDLLTGMGITPAVWSVEGTHTPTTMTWHGHTDSGR